MAAALAVDGLLTVPTLKVGGKCDCNDVYVAEGKEAVWEQFKRGTKPSFFTVAKGCRPEHGCPI